MHLQTNSVNPFTFEYWPFVVWLLQSVEQPRLMIDRDHMGTWSSKQQTLMMFQGGDTSLGKIPFMNTPNQPMTKHQSARSRLIIFVGCEAFLLFHRGEFIKIPTSQTELRVDCKEYVRIIHHDPWKKWFSLSINSVPTRNGSLCYWQWLGYWMVSTYHYSHRQTYCV